MKLCSPVDLDGVIGGSGAVGVAHGSSKAAGAVGVAHGSGRATARAVASASVASPSNLSSTSMTPPPNLPPAGAVVDEDVLAVARDHFKTLRYDLAQPVLHQMVLDGVQRAEVFHMLGAIYHDQSQFKKALRFFKKALALEPGFTDASIGLSVLLNDLGRYDQARQVFEKAQKALTEPAGAVHEQVQHRMAEKHVEMGELYFQHAWYKDAAEQFKKSLLLWPGRIKVFLLLARSYLRIRQWAEAADVLAECLLVHPTCVDARVYLGLCYFKQNRVPEVVEEWERVLEHDPQHRQALKYIEAAQKVRVTT